MAAPLIADATLAALLDDLSSAQARLQAYLAECGRLPGVPDLGSDGWPLTAAHPDLLTVEQTVRRTGMSRFTVNRYCRERGVGRKYGSQWRVSVRRLDALGM